MKNRYIVDNKITNEFVDIYTKTTESYLLDIAASLEKLSEHPISHAIVEKAKLKKNLRQESRILLTRLIVFPFRILPSLLES